jgi:hypothetical protein
MYTNETGSMGSSLVKTKAKNGIFISMVPTFKTTENNVQLHIKSNMSDSQTAVNCQQQIFVVNSVHIQ